MTPIGCARSVLSGPTKEQAPARLWVATPDVFAGRTSPTGAATACSSPTCGAWSSLPMVLWVVFHLSRRIDFPADPAQPRHGLEVLTGSS